MFFAKNQKRNKMNQILIIGAGRSSSSLITYILEQAAKLGWYIIVADANLELAAEKVGNHPHGRAVWLDVTKSNDRKDLIGRVDVVVSLLPAHLHLEVAHDCIKLKKHLITASYVSHELYRLGDEARDRELIFMGEMGLDPGIDHMSAMRTIDRIKSEGGKIKSFQSYTGGLVAPESDDNPWHYKFTWNPRNVVLAGQGTAQYLENGKLKCIPYNRLFEESRPLSIPGLGEYEAYANRDSLLYTDIYGLEGIPNILRATIRGKGFCEAWNALVKIGLTDGDYPILKSGDITFHELMDAYTSPHVQGGSVKDRVAQMLGEEPGSEVMKKLEWLGLFRKKKINLPNATPALILQNLLMSKWEMKKEDKDMIVMYHVFDYEQNGQDKRLSATLLMKGKDAQNTAMAKLVGLPMGIFTKLVMEGQIESKGVHIPVMPEVYNPVLKELAEYGVEFVEEETAI
jgi:saccharopine dehydrogenase-like NADP-dependent oxidoreductase